MRGHDGPAPKLEGVGDSLVGHVADVEDELLAAHRLEQLDAKHCEAPWRMGAAAVAGPPPRRPDDAQPAIGPAAKLGRGLDRVCALHQQYRSDPTPAPAAHVGVELSAGPDEP